VITKKIITIKVSKNAKIAMYFSSILKLSLSILAAKSEKKKAAYNPNTRAASEAISIIKPFL
jgi:hypothetical protein